VVVGPGGVVVVVVEPRGAVVVVEPTGALVDVVVVEIGRVVVVVVDVVVASAPPGREVVVVVVAGCVVGGVAKGMKVPEIPPLVAGDPVVEPLGGKR
jgi:hypothetical protein